MIDLNKKRRYTKGENDKLFYDVHFDFSPKIIGPQEFINILNDSPNSIQGRILLPANNLEFIGSDLIKLYKKNEDPYFNEDEILVEECLFDGYIKSVISDENFHKNGFGLLKKDNLVKYNCLIKNEGLNDEQLLKMSQINSRYSFVNQNQGDLINFWKFRNNNLNFLSIGEIRLINKDSNHLLTQENLQYIAINSVRNILNLKGTKTRDYKSTKKSNYSRSYGGFGDKIMVRKSLEFKLFKNKDPKVFFDVKDYK